MAILGIAVVISLNFGSNAYALPQGGVVAGGAASIPATGTNGALTIGQSSQNAVINWQSFGIGKQEAVTFQQPNSTSVALNRVLGADPSKILGSLSANGQVFLVNPNGVLFGKGAQVNVGGLVASTLDITDANFMAGTGKYQFAGSSSSKIVNRGSINADGGSVALLGANVNNKGVITARLGAVMLAAGSGITLDVAGDGLLNVAVDKGAVNALVKNGGLIQANGGRVVLTAQAAGELLKSAVNNTGVIEAQTVDTRNGTISLLGDKQNGAVNVSGTLDASAPNGGNGGSIETSAAQVNIAPQAKITTFAAAKGAKTGTFLIDPVDFTVGTALGDNITPAALVVLLNNNSVTISTLASPPAGGLTSATPGSGDINIGDFKGDAANFVTWSTGTTLSLNAFHDVNVNAPINGTPGNVTVTALNNFNTTAAITLTGNLKVCCGNDINVNQAITTTNGSVLLNAGHNLTLTAVGAMTTTDGNIELCSGLNMNLAGAITLTNGSTIPAQDLNLTPGLTLIAGYLPPIAPFTAGGTLTIAPPAPGFVVVTQSKATPTQVVIDYNPISYATPIDFKPKFTLTAVASFTEQMLVFPAATGSSGSTTATLSGLLPDSTGVTLDPALVTLVAGPLATAAFVSSSAGSNIGVTYSDFSLGGPNSAKFALAADCCTNVFTTTGTIFAASPPPASPPPASPPPASPPPASPPPASPPPASPPPASPPASPPLAVVIPPELSPVGVGVTPPLSPLLAPLVAPLVVAGTIPELLPLIPAPELTVLGGGVRMPLPPAPAFVAVPPEFPPKQARY